MLAVNKSYKWANTEEDLAGPEISHMSNEQQHACYYTEPTPATFIHPPIHPSITLTLASCLTSLTWKGFWSSIGSGKLVYFDISLAASLKKPPRTRWCQRWSKKREEKKYPCVCFRFKNERTGRVCSFLIDVNYLPAPLALISTVTALGFTRVDGCIHRSFL